MEEDRPDPIGVALVLMIGVVIIIMVILITNLFTT